MQKAMTKEVRNIRRQKLPNGLTVITEQMQHIRSASIGIWLQTGSRDEDPEWNGISHFLEHMVFKGTKHRTAEEIARQVDSIGGNMDAFTAKECICFNVKVLDEHVPTALDILSDLVLNPVFDAADIARERGVILEEIKMDEDNPDYLVHEIFTQNFFKDHPLGKPILGTKETVKRFERQPVVEAYGHRFAPGNIIVSAAGNNLADQLLGLNKKDWNAHYLDQRKQAVAARKARADKLAASRQTGTKPSRSPEAYEGRYEDPAYGVARIEADGGRMVLHWSSYKTKLRHFHYDTFIVDEERFSSDPVSFTLGADGEVQTLRFLGRVFRRMK